jgi:ribosomal protein S18 acetylase RimI-like enzyme
MTDVRVVPAGSERIPELQDLWTAMYEHHAGLPDLPRPRSLHTSWQRRRRQYEEWLAGTDAQLLIAERGGTPVGYALLRLAPGPPTWDIGERVAELESLSVAADARSEGVGASLVAAARVAARKAGAERLVVSVAHANAAALRFYEREGFQPFYVLLAEKDAMS